MLQDEASGGCLNGQIAGYNPYTGPCDDSNPWLHWEISGTKGSFLLKNRAGGLCIDDGNGDESRKSDPSARATYPSMKECSGMVFGSPLYWRAGGYRGCYADNPTWRDLQYINESDSMTPGKCVTACNQAGFRYAGLQFGRTCWCGQAFGSRGGAASNCDMLCTGDPTAICGGVYANSIYDAQ